MTKYEIYWVLFAYEDNPNKYKYRPAIILDNSLLTFTKITSNTNRQGNNEYTIIDWKQAGLQKPSNIRLNKKIPITNNIGMYIGKLTQTDINNLQILGY